MLIRRIPTEKQIAASRANGKKSQGPKTPEGKINSAAANPRHSTLISTVVLHGESTDRFRQLLDSLYAEFLPTCPVEVQLIETMAVSRWRQMRLWALEKATIAASFAKSRPGDNPAAPRPPIDRTVDACQQLSDNSRWTEQMNRAENRHERIYSRAVALFHKHRAWRRGELAKSGSILTND